jgi:hypothetical protein
LWREENEEELANEGEAPSPRNLGITPGGIQSDLDTFSNNENPEGMVEGPEGPEAENAPEGEGGPLEGGGATPAGGPQPQF